MYQKYIVVGRLTKDGENRFLPSGSQVYKNSIASDRKYKKQDGSISTEVMYMDFSAFGGLANTMNTYLHKGSLCLLEGYIQFEQWTANDGSTRSRHSLRVETMKMLDSKNSDSTPPGHQYQTVRESSSPRENQSTYTRKPSMGATVPEIDIDDEIPFNKG